MTKEPQAKEYLRVIGQIEDFLWLVETACQYQLNTGLVQSMAQKLSTDLAMSNLVFTATSKEVEESVETIKQSFLRREYSITRSTITAIKQQIGCA